MRRKLSPLMITALCGLASIVATSPAHANTMYFTGSNVSANTSASALFTTSLGQLQVTLTNLLLPSDIRSASQALSDISFTLSNGPGTLTGTTATGQLGNVSSSGAVTYTSGSPLRFLGQGPAPPNGTGAFTISGDNILMEALGGGQPSEMILPFLANGGSYSNINGSIPNFNPYTIGLATFTLDLSGVTANTTVSNVDFSFGTGEGDPTAPGITTTPPVPEPSSLLLLGTGILAVGGFLRRRLMA